MDWRKNLIRDKDLAYLRRLQSMLELRVPHMIGRGERVAAVADCVAHSAQLGHEERYTLGIGSLYQDLGMLGVPDALLQSDRSLTPSERRLVDNHVCLSGHLLSIGYSDYPELLELTWFHHERPDGQGPLGLKGDLIPIQTQIVSLAGAVESMHYGRPHRPPMSRGDILRELHSGAGTQFDANLVRLFSRIQDQAFDILDKVATEQNAAAQPAPPAVTPEKSKQSQARRGPRPISDTSGKNNSLSEVEPVDVTSKLGHIQQLTALPSTVCEVLMLAGNDFADREELARCIENDAIMVAKVLGLANSSSMGPRRGRIRTISEAVQLLGFEPIKNLATSMGIMQHAGGMDGRSDLPAHVELWHHSLACGIISGILCEKNSSEFQERVQQACRLHDLGKFVLVEHFAQLAEQLARSDGLAYERKLTGTDHAQLGAKVMTDWNISSEITALVARHHHSWEEGASVDPDGSMAELMVQIADALAVATGYCGGFLDYVPFVPADILRRCPDIQSVAASLKAKVDASLHEMTLMLGLFENKTDAEAKEGLKVAQEKIPVRIVTAQPGAVDFVAMWFEYAAGHSLKVCSFEDAKEPPNKRVLTVVNLCTAEPNVNRIDQVNRLLELPPVMVIAPERWGEHLGEAKAAGWPILPELVPLYHLERAVDLVSDCATAG